MMCFFEFVIIHVQIVQNNAPNGMVKFQTIR